MMRRLAAYALLMVALALPGTANAEEVEWDDGPPKGMTDGLVCKATASFGGNTYRYTNYVGADAGQMAANPERERAWQRAHCEWIARQDVPNAFRYRWGQEIDPAIVRVIWEPYRE